MITKKLIDRHIKLPIWLNDQLMLIAEEKSENVSTIVRQALVEYVLKLCLMKDMGNTK